MEQILFSKNEPLTCINRNILLVNCRLVAAGAPSLSLLHAVLVFIAVFPSNLFQNASLTCYSLTFFSLLSFFIYFTITVPSLRL